VTETLVISEDGRGASTSSGPSFILKAGSRFRHFPVLDGLRGTAVLFVVVGHALVFKFGRGYRWSQFAILGVLIFFVLSGFLITGLLCSEERRFGKISLRNFYLRRAFRILPAFSVFMATIILLVHFRLVIDSRRTILAAIFFVKNIIGPGFSALGHLWSLSMEEQFYLVWPIVFRLVSRRFLLAPTLGLIFGVALYRGVAIHMAPYDWGQGIFELRPDFRMDSILVGCALALMLDRRTGQKPFSSFARWGTHPIWVIPLLLYWTVYCDADATRSIYLSVQTALVCCLVFNLIAFPDSVVGHVLRQRWICFVGLVSYSLYLWQQLFLVVSTPSWGSVRDVPFCFLMTGAAAVLSYFFVERPFLRLKRRFSGVQ
jgi:peptidoglycan/LPS O-acetylase OafA/YrhL